MPGSDVCVPALLGMDYPDPLGSSLSVPVLGCHTDPISGNTMPLAGTMEDPGGKGTVMNWDVWDWDWDVFSTLYLSFVTICTTLDRHGGNPLWVPNH